MNVSAVNNQQDSSERPWEENDEVQVPFLNSANTQPKSWTKLLILTAIATFFGTVFPAGFNIGILNSPQQIIKDFCNSSVLLTYGIQIDDTPLELLWSFVVSIFLIGALIGALAGGPIANRVGRKNALLFNASLNVIASVLFGTCGIANSVEMLLLGRLIVGLGAGMSTSFTPLFMSELSTPSTQNILGMICPIGINVGLFIGTILSLEKVLGNEDYWNILLALTSVPALMCLAVWYYLPESPRFLFVNRSKTDEAFQELCRLRSAIKTEIEPELEKLRHEVSLISEETQSSWTMKTVWAKKSLRWPVICVFVMHFGNQLSGINAVFYYSTDIFESAGFDKQQAEFALLGAGLINVLMACVTGYFLGRFGRRPLMIISSIGVSLFLAVLIVAIEFMSSATWVPYTCIVALLIYIIFFNMGVGPLPYFLPTELIPAGPRSLIMSLGCALNWSTNFLVGMTFPLLQNVIGVYTFIIFIFFTSLQTFFLFFKLPETFVKSRQ